MTKDHQEEAESIERYRLLRIIEAGDMTELWLAEQQEPVVRQVALKLIKTSANAHDVIARFESDRQRSALENPAIVNVVEAGITPEGQPYFAMDYVQGKPITAYCRENSLRERERLELFVLVCRAVQYAHQRAIIHRDLQPSNILITTVEGMPKPRIIGFGIANALGVAAEITTYTSPEVAGSTSANVDTRADIYSLGIILQELLTGGPAPNRVHDIARKATEKQPSRRYDSIQEMADDILAFLLEPPKPQSSIPFTKRGALACALILLVFGSAIGIWRIMRASNLSAASKPAMANVTLASQTVKLGHDLEIRIDGVPPDWSGELTVNPIRRFAIDSKVFHLRATAQNGFEVGKTAALYILLVDSKGRQIPVPNGGRFPVSVIRPLASLDREGHNVGPEGWSGSFDITAAADYNWSVSGVPEWIKITSGKTGSGNGVVTYTVLKNETNQERSAVLAVGDGVFSITQVHPLAIQLPFRDRFQYSSAPPESWSLRRPGITKLDESPTHWVWEQIGGQRATLAIAHESPSEGNSLLIRRPVADHRAWATLVYLPQVDFEPGSQYSMSVWMKAENLAPVGFSIGQNSPPWADCGVQQELQVTKEWTKYDVPIKVTGANCGPANNRLVFAAGRIQGKLWIADVFLSKGR